MFGKFYSGDSYLVLHTIRENGPWRAFFWLGEKTSQDEMGTAAYKVVELCETLGRVEEQRREVQGHESGKLTHVYFNIFQLCLLQFFLILVILLNTLLAAFPQGSPTLTGKKIFKNWILLFSVMILRRNYSAAKEDIM